MSAFHVVSFLPSSLAPLLCFVVQVGAELLNVRKLNKYRNIPIKVRTAHVLRKVRPDFHKFSPIKRNCQNL